MPIKLIRDFLSQRRPFKISRRGLRWFFSISLFLIVVPIHVLPLAEYRYVDVTWTEEGGRDLNFEIEKPAHWVPLNQISRNLRLAIISSEDSRFYQHPGFEIEAISKALQLAIKTHQFKKGGSTITQQLAKNLYFAPDKTIIRKIRELQAAIYIEWRWGKDRILETYLNVIEFGPGLYGIDRASHYYFKKDAKNLSSRESAFIAMLLPNPKKYSKSYRQGNLTRFAKKRVEQILRVMYKSKYITSEQKDQEGSGFLKQPVPTAVPTPELPIVEEELDPNPDSEAPLPGDNEAYPFPTESP